MACVVVPDHTRVIRIQRVIEELAPIRGELGRGTEATRVAREIVLGAVGEALGLKMHHASVLRERRVIVSGGEEENKQRT
jgi:hypothetical protein